MKKFSLFFLLFFFLFVQVKTASAHIGGGPPFLEVNTKYALTNPFFSNDPTINIPQDTNPETNPILVGQKINFVVDTSKLLVPPEIANASTFRWSFSENSKDYIYGTQITHTYLKAGSYLITLDVKGPTDTDYLTIDTTQVSILPYLDYHVPQIALRIETENHNSNKPIFFKTTITTDRHAKVKTTIWALGDGNSSNKQNVMHTYTNITNYSTYPVVFRVIDSNNFITDTGVIIQVVNNKLQFIDATGKTTTIPASDTITQDVNPTSAQVKNNFLVPLLSTSTTIIAVLAIFFVFVRKRRKK